MDEQFKFFVVDDDIFCANMHQQFLKNLNFKDIIYFSNGIECLNNLHLKPDIIFLDYNMNDMNGFEVLKKIKRYNPNIYVVIISSQESLKIAVDALKYGAFDYIIKDNNVCDKIALIISNIIKINIQLKKSKPKFIKRIFPFL
jgi:polysaccharide export outer membrane protein